jgi:cellulose biosynthesis protein BcsQ
MSKRIAFFNHKGGVGKTIAAYHLGWRLTNYGHKVLLVDGDSQVNLTAIALGTERFDVFYDEEETKDCNIRAGIAPVFEGQPRAIEAFDCQNALGNSKLFVLPGHLDLQSYEGQLSLAQETGGTLSVLRNLPGAMNGLITAIEGHHAIDFTIIDLNPGLGAINQNLFLCSDSFIVPTNPDPFSIMAIYTLSDRVTKWSQWLRAAYEIYKDTQYPVRPQAGVFLGAITSRFNKHSSKAARKFDERIREIDSTIEKELFPKLTSAGMAFTMDKYRQAFDLCPGMGPGMPTSALSLARIPDFQSLAQIASDHEVPVFALKEAMLREARLGGSSLDSAMRNVAEFDTIFQSIATKVKFLLDAN